MSLPRHRWLLAASALFVAGALGSVAAAQAIARSDSARSRQAFDTSSAEIAATLGLTIQHEQDLAVSAGAFVANNPDTTQAQFEQWTASVRAFGRYPELEDIGEILVVPAAGLDAFAARELGHPTGPLAADGTFVVTPGGSRPYYCFETVLQARGQTLLQTPAGADLCDSVLAPELLTARDSGRDTLMPLGTGKGTTLNIQTAVYRGGVVPSTVQARQAALLGWTGILILPSVILTTALKGHPNTSVVFHYVLGSIKVAVEKGTQVAVPVKTVSLRAGTAPAGAQSTTVNLHNGWRVQTFGAVSSSGLFANQNALAVLLAGIVVSLLLALLLHVLGTGRARAVLLVNERTGQLRHQALHDSLTGLPNRALIFDRMEQMLARGRREHTPVAALFLDLDDFKDINDTLGHSAGDQLLCAVGARLTSALRGNDTVGRLGGDEFIVLVEGASLAAGVVVVGERILDVLQTPFEIAGSDVPLTVTASIGIASGTRTTAESLLQDSDIALYRAKAAGKRQAVVFAASMQHAVDDHRSLEVDLHKAVDGHQFFLLYQPTVDLATGTFNGVEALLRWQHPQRGVVLPDDFISTLESTGLIVPVGRWVLEVACRQGARWAARGHAITVSVNISARQLEGDQIVEDVRDALAASGLDPGLLLLELTETTLMHDVAATITRLDQLKAMGLRLAIDDFGTGYSSIAYLRQFPIDVLKIDRSFVAGIADTIESAALVHTLVQLGKVLGLETIAEGIEDDDQRMRLQAEEVDGGQGFLFGRPLEVGTLERLLERAVIPADPAIAVPGGART